MPSDLQSCTERRYGAAEASTRGSNGSPRIYKGPVKDTGAYNTTPTRSLEVLSNIPPLFLEAKRIFDVYAATSEANVERAPLPKDKLHPAHRCQWVDNITNSTQYIYVDGSKTVEATRAAMVAYSGTHTTESRVVKLPEYSTTYQAEVAAINLALEYIQNNPRDSAIVSDSQSAVNAVNVFKAGTGQINVVHKCLTDLWDSGTKVCIKWESKDTRSEGSKAADRAARTGNANTEIATQIPKSYLKKKARNDMLAQWQKVWDETTKGRFTHAIVPQVPQTTTWWSRETIWAITGHGPYSHYFNKFRLKRHNVRCACGEESSPEHTFYHCPYPQRTNARQIAQGKLQLSQLELTTLNLGEIKHPEVIITLEAFFKELIVPTEDEDD
ncbi:hypothetical protein PPYR_02573 [Photinus pyralis]|uniref:RNase H type-1 domain-containing protein n=1 Tax=Photinus pyralis TaxID=7054 RepID=A0A5N4B7U6_PHOPY|nr:hypothetical protein PPYR_02573 [Photinus pyralis]